MGKKADKTEVEAESEPNYSDPEDFVDDMPEEELMADFLAKEPRADAGVADRCILVDKVPIVAQDRFSKLNVALVKVFSRVGTIRSSNLPVDDKGMTKGIFFVEYEKAEQAREAVHSLHGYQLDRSHTFSVLLLSEFDKFMHMKDEFVPPPSQPFHDRGNLRGWLQDVDASDQLAVVSGVKSWTVNILWHRRRELQSLENRSDWTEMRVAWSPLGTYLATFHARGIAVWAGPRFTQLARFPHQRLETLDFSPRERFLVTYSNMDDSPENPHGVIVWETKTGTCCRVFYRDPTIEGLMLKWNFDDSIIAKLGNDCIYLYETRTFSLLEQKGQRVERVRELSWSPTESTLAFWTEERPDVPSRVVIQSIELTPPSASAPGVPQFVRKELRSSNLFEVADVAFHWHRSGDYLCVRVSRYAKKAVKKDAATGAESIKYLGQYVNLEIFHIREKGCPVDKLEIKEELHFLAWEPIGTRFAFISGQLGRTCVQLYAVEPVVTKLRVFDKSSVNQLYWSPSGQYLVLASVHQQNASGGSLDFVDAEHQTIVNSGDHPGLSICEWDPTGRFFVSCVSLSSQKIDNGLMFWSCMGRTLFKHSVDHLTQFVWRPRPPSPLTESALKEIKKNMKKYSPHFELQDRLLESELSKELLERREHQMSDFRDWYARLRHELNHPREKQQRLQLRDKEADDRERAASREMVEEKFEFLVSVNRENQSGDP